MSEARPLAAIILAAGLGTRMRSGKAKVLHEIGGEPMIARALRAIAELKPDLIITVVGHQAEAVAETVRHAVPNHALRFAVQSAQRGTGDAARTGLGQLPADFDGDILIGYGDTPRLNPSTLMSFREAHHHDSGGLAFISTEVANPDGYGRVVRNGSGAIERIVEHRDASAVERTIREINTGIYLAEARLLREALAALTDDNVQREFYLTDIVAIAYRRGARINAWRARNPAEFEGINTREELGRMNQELRNQRIRALMDAGVTFIDPATAYISDTVVIGADTTIGPNVQILGNSRIGSGVMIEGTAWLREVTVGDRCHLKICVRAEECTIGDDSEIGPFANLRAGTELAGHNRIGNFVETKKTRIGRGSKASHLSYLGDAVIGSETNIGCGVITVNYDGYDKHVTAIGDRCMVGCDTQLVAPVTVGSDVYIASGTTILKDVQDGALALSYHPQDEKPGWTAGWRRRHKDHPQSAKIPGTK
ncbi:MAG TPA: bifunctional UDP-N-acetylglucosamine diphosphorylase/glucosamine-1-phosphate N-acetyltransferase GlmU [Candidatus Binataceae bacterium]|nr:bifunctional UDP-N-acetylglucosamine diphosphorylase/glucosamine-1-phosphate N-acetyltransferase GlmU [Candidatus Binataceae bacterium]